MRMSREEREREIVEAGQRVCAEKGFAGTTLDDIAEEAGISRQLIIQYFGGKEGLYVALVESSLVEHPLGEDEDLLQAIQEKDDHGVFYASAHH
jgi:AcrR family transcriptional regulator